jgi:uncharacterized membrane protein YvlD (DUF360 family)
LNLCPIVVFFNHKIFINELLLALVDQMTKDIYVFFVISLYILTITFNLWMFKGTHDIFVFILSFLLLEWELTHVTIGLFETNTNEETMAIQLQTLHEKHDLMKK